MFLATLDTPNFGFVVLEDTKENALELMRQAWNKHQEQTDAQWDWERLEDSVFITFIRCGDVLRDTELMHSYDTPNGWNQTTTKGEQK
jgi:hypothetical protein